MNQSHNGAEGCIHGDVYTVNSQLTCGVRDEDTQVVLHQSMRRREGAEAIVAWNIVACAEQYVSITEQIAKQKRCARLQKSMRRREEASSGLVLDFPPKEAWPGGHTEKKVSSVSS